MAIKFTGKDQPKAVPVAPKASAEKPAREPASAKDETPADADLFNADAKGPAGKRKSK